MTGDLAARSAFEIVRDALRVYRKNVPVLILGFALPQFLALLALMATMAAAAPSMVRIEGQLQMVPPTTGQIVLCLVGWVAAFAGQALVTGAMMVAVAQVCAGGVVRVGGAYRRIWQLGWRFLGASVLFYLISLLGFALLLLPGLAAFVYLCVAGPAVAVERLRPVAAIKRSYALVKGRFWHVAGVVVAIAALILLLQVGLSALQILLTIGLSVLDDGAGWLADIVGLLLQMALLPLLLMPPVLIYLDLRVRKEGLDQATLAAELAR